MEWIFKMYDLNGDGTISMEEMVEVFQAIYDMVGHLVQLRDEVGVLSYIIVPISYILVLQIESLGIKRAQPYI